MVGLQKRKLKESKKKDGGDASEVKKVEDAKGKTKKVR